MMNFSLIISTILALKFYVVLAKMEEANIIEQKVVELGSLSKDKLVADLNKLEHNYYEGLQQAVDIAKSLDAQNETDDNNKDPVSPLDKLKVKLEKLQLELRRIDFHIETLVPEFEDGGLDMVRACLSFVANLCRNFEDEGVAQKMPEYLQIAVDTFKGFMQNGGMVAKGQNGEISNDQPEGIGFDQKDGGIAAKNGFSMEQQPQQLETIFEEK